MTLRSSILTKQDFLIHMRTLREFRYNCSALTGIINTSYTDELIDKHVRLLEYAVGDTNGFVGDFVFETLVEDWSEKKLEELYSKL